MCGIFGYLDHMSSQAPDEAKLRESAASLSHRGPDAVGVFREPSVGLVHTRLSLVDLDPRSNQPFWDRSGRWALAFNGEIYNFPELRAELEKKAVSFRTTGDTEVLLESLLAGGLADTLRRLEGMFAFALYDREEKTLTLARDRVGMKPLFYYQDDSRFVFASEIKAMRGWIPWEAEPAMVAPYLHSLHWVTEGFRLYRGVEALPPGACLRIRRGGAPETGRFFSLGDFWDPEERARLERLSPTQAVDHVEKTLLRSVEMQLRADAPLGVFCSGGVDSSLIAAMAARFSRNLTLFHSNIVGKWSEYAAAKALSDHLKVELVAQEVRDESYVERIPDAMLHAEFPFRHLPTSPPFLMLSEAARERGVKGLLTGEASDEGFLGYQKYAPNVLGWLRQAPRNVYRLLRGRAGQGRLSHLEPQAPLSARFVQHFREDLEKDAIRADVRRKAGREPRFEDLCSLYDFAVNIRALTHRNDSMGMSAGVEARFPFLDTQVIRSGINLPRRYKLRFSPAGHDPEHLFFRDKWVIREVAARYLPHKLSHRIKIGWPTSFLARMQIDPEFFIGGSLAEWLGLSERELRWFVSTAPQHLHTTLMYLEAWAHLCYRVESREELRRRMRSHIRLRAER